MTTLRVPCDADPACHHRACLDCGRPMRTNHDIKDDHPGTRTHQRGGSCSTCCWGKVRLIPADLEDQRHILLPDDELMRISWEHPHLYTWYAQRRKRLKIGEYA